MKRQERRDLCADLKEKATELLGTMLGGYNVKPLIDLPVAQHAAPLPLTRRKLCWFLTSS